jgi:hypothetical protein
MPRPRRYVGLGQEVVVPSAARTTTGTGTAVQGWSRGGPDQQSRLTITAASGTSPSLTVIVEDSPDNSTWTTRDTYPAQTTTATVTRALPANMAAFQRVRWTISGTSPSFTFSVQFAASTAALA